MRVLAIMGSYRPGKTIDTLVDRAIEGAKSNGDVDSEKVILIDKQIEYCRNCMVCRNDDPAKTRARCVISDDMDAIGEQIEQADAFIFGTPVNMGATTAVMKTFLERICWVFAKPGRWPVRGCPTPRGRTDKKAIIIVSSGIIRPLLRRWCDDATPMIRDLCAYSLGAKTVGTLYAGAVEKTGLERYLDRAHELGKRLCHATDTAAK